MNDIKCDICGKSFKTESELFQFHWRPDCKCLIDNNISPDDKKTQYLEQSRGIQIDELKRRYYEDKISLKQLAREMNFSYEVLKKILLHCGLVLRDVKDVLKIHNENMRQKWINEYGTSSFGIIGNLPRCREKAKQTCLKNNGVENPTQSQEIRDRVRSTVRENWNVDNVFQSDEIKERIRQKNRQNLGVDYPSQSKEIILKIIKNNREKYGCDWYMQTNEFKERYKQTMQENYGVDNYFQTKHFKNYLNSIRERIQKKQRETNEELGIWIKGEFKTDFQLYCLEVNRVTKKVKKQLFSEWNGLCYYTNQKLITKDEYIKQNPNKHPNTNRLSPSIDHKISKMYGFLNEIDPKIIGGLDNLCICARYINSIKNKLTNFEFEKIVQTIERIYE